MSSLDFDGTPETPQSPRWGKGPVIVLTAGLVLALAGDGYLLKRTSDTDDQMARMQADTQTQITKLGDSTTDHAAATPESSGRRDDRRHEGRQHHHHCRAQAGSGGSFEAIASARQKAPGAAATAAAGGRPDRRSEGSHQLGRLQGQRRILGCWQCEDRRDHGEGGYRFHPVEPRKSRWRISRE